MKTRSLFYFFSALCSLAALTSASHAAPPDVAGAWKWEMRGQGGETRTLTATLKQDGGKVTGTVAGPQGREIEIQEGKISDQGDLAFAVRIERGGRDFTTHYKAKVTGDKLAGTIEFATRDGETRSRDWEARREAPNVTGKWKTVRTMGDGRTVEFIYDLKQDGEKLTGTTSWNDSESVEIQEGKVQGKSVSFTVVRERDGRSFRAEHKAKVEGEKIMGNVQADWGEGSRNFDWEATRVR